MKYENMSVCEAMSDGTRGVSNDQPVVTSEAIESIKKLLDEHMMAEPKIYVSAVLPHGSIMVSKDIYEYLKHRGVVN